MKIIDDIKKILVDDFGYKGIFDWEKIKDVPLTSSEFGFDGISLYYFMLAIVKKMNIYFMPNEFNQLSFFTLSDVVDSITLKMKNNK